MIPAGVSIISDVIDFTRTLMAGWQIERNNLAITLNRQRHLARLETIHTMTMRLNEIMQLFSSLAGKVQLAEKESQSETETSARCAAYAPDSAPYGP